MKKTPIRRRSFYPKLFSDDKHWVLILLIGSNLVLLSLVFILLNQNQTPTYQPAKTSNQASTSAPSSGGASTTVPTIANSFPEIKRLLLLGLSGQQPLVVDSQKISSFSPAILQFYNNDTNKNIFYTFRLKTYKYDPGSKLITTISGQKYTVDLDKWVSWLSNLNGGKQEIQVYSDQGLAPKATIVTSKKIGTNVFYLNDYKLNSSLTREYITYDTNQKQIIKITVETSEPNEFFPDSLNLFKQIESILATK